MAARLACCLGLLAICSVCQAPTACGDPPAWLSRFGDEPADALMQQLEGGLGWSLGLSVADADSLTKRWRIYVDNGQKVVAEDPLSGLAVRQQHRWIPKLNLLFIDTTLTCRGKLPAEVNHAIVGDWHFRVLDQQDGSRYRQLTYRNDTWYGSTYWTGPDWTRVGKDWHHSGINTPSVRRFHVPRTGRVTIGGRVYKLDTNHGGGDGVRLSIRHGRKTVWQAEIDGGDTQGLQPNISLDVRKGEAIRFVVHKRGGISYDTTHWDPLVTYADGEGFQASKGFSTRLQGQANWCYEMEVTPQTESGLPQVHGFARDLTPRVQTPTAARPVILSERDALPVMVVADGLDKSGIAVALTAARSWQFRSSLTKDGQLRVQLVVADAKSALSVKPGQSVELPRVVLLAYRGSWLAGVTALQRVLSATDQHVDGLRQEISAALVRATGGRGSSAEKAKPLTSAAPRSLEFNLWVMLQSDWRQRDQLVETVQSYAEATAEQIGKTRQLLADLQQDQPAQFLAAEAEQLEQLATVAQRSGQNSLEARRSLYLRVRWLKRRIALANPLMQFRRLLFCKRAPTSYSHQVMQYYGWRARPGGGLFILDNPGYSLAARDVLDGKLADGNVLEPRLSYDAKRIVFSYVECKDAQFDPSELANDVDVGFYHVYEVNVDGTGLRQLTDGPYDDLMPTYLPDGGIAFCSSRRRGHSRCFGAQFSRRWQVYTLHRMDADGGHIRTLSYHDTNEWFPAVSNDGRILYARWDYIDRDAVTHQNLWASRADGTNPVAIWGNATASPHCTFQVQAIPGSPKMVFTASAHHSITAGSIALVDPTRGNDGQQAITRITPEVPFPEAEGRDIQQYYAAPWPLSEKYFLVAYSPKPLVWEPGANDRNALGIYLLDAFGNRELIYRDPEIGSTSPCPLVTRKTPPVVTSNLPADAQQTGVMALLDVYRGLGDLPRGSIKELRIIQILPKTTHVADKPPIGLAGEENARAILGTVPVEPDGSAHFIVPARKPILFQALDHEGFAYQTMRSLTYVQPGEHVTCIGCHESRVAAPGAVDPMALRRAPSRIDPGEIGGRPFSFVEVVQPVLDKHCVQCHGASANQADGGIDLSGTPHDGFTRSYWSLCGDRSFNGSGTNAENAAKALVPRFGARNPIQTTPPGGIYGALGSRLIRMLRAGHYDAQLTPQELRRLAAWVDCNAIFYGAYDPDDQARQLRGEILAMPEIQ